MTKYVIALLMFAAVVFGGELVYDLHNARTATAGLDDAIEACVGRCDGGDDYCGGPCGGVIEPDGLVSYGN